MTEGNICVSNTNPRILTYGACLIGSIFVLVPVLWMVSTSLKTEPETFAIPPRWIPETVTLDSYRASRRSSKLEILESFFIDSDTDDGGNRIWLLFQELHYCNSGRSCNIRIYLLSDRVRGNKISL